MACEGSHTLTISQVAEQTGVNPVTLRAWQRRYGLLSPARTAKGHQTLVGANVRIYRCPRQRCRSRFDRLYSYVLGEAP